MTGDARYETSPDAAPDRISGRIAIDTELAAAINYRLGINLSLSDVAAVLHILAYELEIRNLQELECAFRREE
jgi:hypothetical protein